LGNGKSFIGRQDPRRNVALEEKDEGKRDEKKW